jgi:hypothetical protein
MPLALAVALVVVGVIVLLGLVGYLIDWNEGREERKWER